LIRPDGFQHEAFLYGSDAEFLDGTSGFIRQGLADDAATLVVVDRAKIERLRTALGPVAASVEFADMATVGQNPARIIPAWQDFVDRHRSTGRPLRGIGEPIWPGRGQHELVECRHHEALLNVAFADSPPFRLLCPYDTAALDPVVVEQAHGTHPFVSTPTDHIPSAGYDGTHPDSLFTEPLTPPPPDASTLSFRRLAPVRSLVARVANHAGFAGPAASDVVLAVHEIAANSLRYGGGQGLLTLWRHDATLICQVRDRGHITDPLAGRRRPTPRQLGQRGLWIANHLSRLLQIRTSPHGTTVRLHFPTPDAS
jgi:anti-sigma regulatory factor (Ser/Thr protein kinase)